MKEIHRCRICGNIATSAQTNWRKSQCQSR